MTEKFTHDDEIQQLWGTSNISALNESLNLIRSPKAPPSLAFRLASIFSTKDTSSEQKSWFRYLPALAPACAALLFVFFIPTNSNLVQSVSTPAPSATQFQESHDIEASEEEFLDLLDPEAALTNEVSSDFFEVDSL